MNWLIWPPLALVLLAYPWIRHEGYADATALTMTGTLVVTWILTCGVAVLVRARSHGLAWALALLWLPASLLALALVGVLTFEASGL